MHIGQAIKMAFKSLWTNKLRSFLTMLGIIIGVVTVTLLTTVAQGVSDAVVSSIRSQSTLSVVMGVTDNVRYGKLNTVLSNKQPEESAADYYKYSLAIMASSVAAQNLTGLDEASDDFKNALHFKKIAADYTEEELESMFKGEMSAYRPLFEAIKDREPLTSSIYAVSSNFNDVYELSFDGKFPTADDEILVDKSFLKTYLGENFVEKEAINEIITLGVEYYKQITIKFNADIDTDTQNEIANLLVPDGETIGRFTKFQNAENKFEYSEKVMTLQIEFYSYMTNDALTNYIQTNLLSSHVAELATETPVVVETKYSKENAKNFKIVGILKDDNSTLFTGNNSTSEDGSTSAMRSLMSSSKGTCYMLLNYDNLKVIGQGNKSSLNDAVVTYAYLRYKTEDVMSESSGKIMLALMIEARLKFAEDFMMISLNSVAKIIAQVMSILTTMLTVIAVISLIVGGIGIMNIMLVAVTERTREIGVRKAIGAKRASILMQFLIEALMLSLIGGLIGLGISAIGTAIIGHVMGFAMNIPLWVIAMSLGFCTAIGLIFGMFPAVKASHMQPIDALRRE